MTALYLHIPFCLRKCPYCDFFSVEAGNPLLADYPQFLIRQLDLNANRDWSGPIETVYFGGGTPSLLEPAAVAGILAAAERNFGLVPGAEITLEANPGTVTEARLRGYRSAGVNRLSLGLQSCHGSHLATLGRLHDRRQGFDAVRWARRAGFDNLSLDLMFALPGQTLAGLAEDLADYLDLVPEHLSCYGLTAEPQTPFQRRIARGELTLPDEEFYADAYLLIRERLTGAGYRHYEIANYAREGRLCRHNLGYWLRRPCLGVGAGAHSFAAGEWGSRWEVPADLAAYLSAVDENRDPLRCLERFDRSSALSETIYLALRTDCGVDDGELQLRFGCTLQEAFPEAVAASAEWLVHENGRWILTPSGWLLFDRLILPFL